MRNLIEYINESLLVNESLQSKWLQMLVKAANTKLGNLNRNIRWDKVTDDAFQEYEPGSDVVKKLVRKIRNYNSNDMIMILSSDKSSIKYLVVYGWFIMVSNESTYRYKDEKEYTIKDYVDQLPCVVLDLDNHDEYVIKNEDPDSRLSRNNAHNGSIESDYDVWSKKKVFGIYNDGDLIDIAKENIKRYKDILAKKHADDLDDNGLYKDVQETMDKVLKFVSEHQETDKMYKRQELLVMLYSKISFSKGRQIAQNGLLPLYNAYLESKGNLELSKADKYFWGNSDSLLKRCKSTSDAIHVMIDKINEMIDKY